MMALQLANCGPEPGLKRFLEDFGFQVDVFQEPARPSSRLRHPKKPNDMRVQFLSKLLGVCCVSSLIGAGVSHATGFDLSATGGGTVNGAVFSIDTTQPAGTGVFDPFITIQNKGSEQGYNSSFSNFDTKREPQWNHEIGSVSVW